MFSLIAKGMPYSELFCIFGIWLGHNAMSKFPPCMNLFLLPGVGIIPS